MAECPIKCGSCCRPPLVNTLTFTQKDIQRWTEQARQDILIEAGKSWLQHQACPFLTDKGCAIFETRPQVCVDYLCQNRELKLIDGSEQVVWNFSV